jgi:hypothetical protein
MHFGTARDLNVVGNGRRAAANDVFAQTMIVSAACPRRVRDCGCHPRSITGTSENLNDIEAAALANKKFKMSSFAARFGTIRAAQVVAIGITPRRFRTLEGMPDLGKFTAQRLWGSTGSTRNHFTQRTDVA